MKEIPKLTTEPDSPEDDVSPYEIKSPEDWETLASDLLEEKIQRMDIENLKDLKLLWRGMDPAQVLDLVLGRSDKITLASERPNTSIDWEKAISYTREREGIKLNAALGFLPEDDWKIEPATTTLSSKDILEGALEYQRGNFVANGDIRPEDCRCLIIRFHAKKGQEMPKPIVYRIDWRKIIQDRKTREAA